MLNLKSILVAGAAIAGLAGPAAAQWYGGTYSYNVPPPAYGYGSPEYRRPLPRDLIVERLEDRGFDDVGRPRFDGSVYVVEATGRRGGAVRLEVDAFDGRILRQTPLTIARLEPLDDDFGLDGYAAPRRGYAPPEMPDAPRYRDLEPLPGRQAARPAEPTFDAPAPRAPRPADPRLAPNAPAAAARPTEPPEPRREARRPTGPEAGVPSGGVEGVNPDRKSAAKPEPKPRPAVAAKPDANADPTAKADKPTEKAAPAKPAARTSPAAPAPNTVAKPADKKPGKPGPTTAEAGERKVRVIEGVTPMNSGGLQSTPAPQNNVDAGPKADGAAQAN